MGDQVAVWSWRIETDSLSFEAAEALLSEDEKARGRSFVTISLRHRFVAVRARLRTLLGEHLGLDPRTLVFVQNAFGKPRLADHPSVHFSLSHSSDQAVLAVSEQREVGIDIERVRPLDHLDLARRYFHPNEVAAIEGAQLPQEQLLAFFRVWTLKEAVVKAIGKGLSIPLDTFDVSIATSPPTMVVAPEGAPRTWWLHQTTGGYCLALAVPGGGDVGLIQRTV
ncbi:MAG: 4'-phosphopantetheinyl transferase superfamily protein [Reyranella sp.]|nr:4'-phosphopantetheinyl transferase superfamily protein [Reyranella sp.]MDP3159713.1 4'-phosphopantetheinyl transferase superfamily protein [Reyranella sp.]